MKSMMFFSSSLVFLFIRDYIPSLMLFVVGTILLLMAKKPKSIYLKDNSLVYKGIYTNKTIPLQRVVKVSYFIHSFFIKIKGGPRIFFIAKLSDEIEMIMNGKEASKEIFEE